MTPRTALWVVAALAFCVTVTITHMAKISELDHRLTRLERHSKEQDRLLVKVDDEMVSLHDLCVSRGVCVDDLEDDSGN